MEIVTVVWRFYDSVCVIILCKKLGNDSNEEDACKQDNNFHGQLELHRHSLIMNVMYCMEV